MSSNFDFLDNKFPVLARFGKLAEQYCFSDSNTCLIKLGMLGETIVNLMFIYDGVTPPSSENTASARINTLMREGFLPEDLCDILHVLRRNRNKAAHENYESEEKGKSLLQMAHSLCEWFMQTYGDKNYENQTFVMPAVTSCSNTTALNARSTLSYVSQAVCTASVIVPDEEQEKQIEDRLIKEAEETAFKAPKISKEERIEQARQASIKRKISEAETRYLIDEQLRKVGWEADTENLRYSKGTRPERGRNMAIAEWPTDSCVGNKGYADYALFIGTKLVGVIEAKAMHKDVSSVIDNQCKDYSRNIRKKDSPYQIGTWGSFKVPFTFATNGRDYLEQYKTKSGIWFLDLRNPSNSPKALHGWISPSGLEDLLDPNIGNKNTELQQMPFDFLTDEDGLNLRQYQVNAIKVAEKAVIDGKKTVLLAMATGTGKTRTVLGMIYRFLKTERFHRILFLVDRTSLGEQAQDVFKEVRLEELMTLNDIYNIKNLDDKDIDKETRVQVATVQSMVKRILFNSEETKPAVSDYDLIVVDEAHRGYILDKEMGDDELLYRNQKDYQSKYRYVIEYFEAVKIALTATPALHTTEIFGEPVFQYTYREAVVDGYLVDHDAPHQLKTKLSTEGIHFKKGENVAIYDSVTHVITNSALLSDELDFDIDDFNRKVITESFNRVVLQEIARDIDPENPKEQGKTLIYAVDDKHADMIVSILKEIYSKTCVDNDAIMKITGSIGGGNKKKVQEAINRFKNEDYPSMVVTVDLLTTGIDVPEITTLVFMRRVKSRILFEQMLGRATRLCPNIQKSHFEIYDPVGVYDALEPVTTMKPIVADPKTTFEQLIDGLETVNTEELIRNNVNKIIAKLQRLKRKMSDEVKEQFVDLSGGFTPDQFIKQLKRESAETAKNRILGNKKLFKMLQEVKSIGGKPIVVSNKEDRLLEHTREFGNQNKPGDYLDEFSAFLKTNINKIAALNIVCTRPMDLTRDDLKSLRLALDREGFTEQQLNTAISQMSNEAIVADIISLIRRYAIGSTLVSKEYKIKTAVERLIKAHSFTKQEMTWVKRMETYLLNKSFLNVKVFDDDVRFRQAGGFNKINKIFQDQLDSIVNELNTYLYDDGGLIA